MYALGRLTLIRQAACADTVQSWFADDSSAAGRLRRLRRWWDVLTERGRAFGYLVNAKKSVLVIKEECLLEARNLFQNTGIKITSDGARYLGTAIGSSAFKEDYGKSRVENWVCEVERLAVIAWTQPQTTYSAFTSGLRGKWTFLCRLRMPYATILSQS